MSRDGIQRHRGKRSREARQRRALTKALRAHSTVGVREQREGVFHPNHERLVFHDGERVPDDPPRDEYFIPAPGVEYVEVCDFHFERGHGYDPDCKKCRRETVYERPA